MLLNKLESGLLLFQTQQGLVAVEPSFWQRVYLLWTFRNFRQLSLALLNPRQTALINDLFRQHAAVAWHEYEPSLEIGVVQDFVPPGTGAGLAARTDESPAADAKLPEQTAGEYVAPPIIPMAIEPAAMADAPPAVEKEETENDGAGMDRVEFAPRSALDRSFAPTISWPKIPWLKGASSHLRASTPAASPSQVSRPVIFRFAAAIGALLLGAFFIVAFHRVGAVPGSPAPSSPPQLSSPDSPSAPDAPPVAENPAPVPDGPAEAGDGPDAAVEPAPAKEASSITPTHRTMTPDRASHGGTAHVASRSRGGQHTAAFSRVPASTSTRRVTSAPASRRPMARSAQSYFDLANQQMHNGNYAAAAANYKRAWRIKEDRASAKGRLVRARRATQAKNENIANRR